ncbi:MAG: UMP kinase [Deltaproteobacteria bacterium RIFCSPLOWO2_02_FULL_44_10]|nr:MAG: UMP kinase [Deltaproteobacteria bacterium RIFCSPHIGHO2_02_FULL_44_16]OGQ46398.1 MAG: UMP kinase [Deltaproteobacteria bacterium RIFCSPLOWO2_02_FULL_44_10]
MTKPKYKRVLLKLSGESLLPPDSKYGVNLQTANHIAAEIKVVTDLGVQVGVVIGAGNIFRGAGAAKVGMDRSTADNMGMLATVINSLALQDAMIRLGISTRLLTSFTMHQVGTPYSHSSAMRYLAEGSAVIFAGGTGNPYFTTDTAASLRALEIHADIVCKGTKVDGVYSSDPELDRSAKRYDELSYIEVLSQNLKVMDATAISLCMEAKLPILVFNVFEKGNFQRAVLGEKIGTMVHE